MYFSSISIKATHIFKRVIGLSKEKNEPSTKRKEEKREEEEGEGRGGGGEGRGGGGEGRGGGGFGGVMTDEEEDNWNNWELGSAEHGN